MIFRLSLLFTFFIVSILQPLSAQMEVSVRRSEFKIKETGFHDAWRALKEGDRLAAKGKGALYSALAFYLKAYPYNPENAELNFKIGACYLQTDKKCEAIRFLSKTYASNPQIIPEINYMLAKAYHFNLEFENAIKEYEFFYQTLTRKEKKTIGPGILKHKEECLNAKLLIASPQRMIIKNMGDSVNSSYDDYNSVIGPNDSVMYFISRRPVAEDARPNVLDFRHNEDIYFTRNDSGNWANARRWKSKFNNKHHTGIVWLTADGKTLFLYNGYKDNGDLMYSLLKNGKWTKPSKLRRGFNTDEKETSLTMTANEKEVYFVSADPRESFGGKDVFYSYKNERGKWTSPKNAGSEINTMYDEEGVYVNPDGKTLYFSSKGHDNMGGYDIFKVEKDSKNVWSKAKNMGYPLNTPDDELFYRPSADVKQAYFSTIRPDTKGGKDIYKVIFLGAEKEMLLLSEDRLISYKEQPYNDIFVRGPQLVSIDTSVTLKGVIIDAKTQKPVSAKINLIDIDRSLVVATTISDSTGSYQIPLPEIKKYGIELNARDYMFLLDIVTMPANITGRTVVRNFAMSRVEVGAKVVLKNIYFETGKATLMGESFAELDKVHKFLQENTDLKIEISGHTDNVGSLKLNTTLSESRAKSVVDYLANKGIAREQLVFKGYGPSQPIAPNTTAAGKKLNRRVEFKILSKE